TRYAELIEPICAAVKCSTSGFCKTALIAPIRVTSSPSSTHVIPRPITNSQWKRLHGSRSSRAGIRVSKISVASSFVRDDEAEGSAKTFLPGVGYRQRLLELEPIEVAISSRR